MKIFILEKYSPEDDYDEDRLVDRLTVLNVFSTRELAQAWLNAYIREEWQIEDDFTDDLEDEVYPVEFFIKSYEVLTDETYRFENGQPWKDV
jgi:hypothetical protein